MVKETLPQLNAAMLEAGENVIIVVNLTSLISTYYLSLKTKQQMPEELVNELTRDFASNLHQKAAGF